jgi:hypothetical protein
MSRGENGYIDIILVFYNPDSITIAKRFVNIFYF